LERIVTIEREGSVLCPRFRTYLRDEQAPVVWGVVDYRLIVQEEGEPGERPEGEESREDACTRTPDLGAAAVGDVYLQTVISAVKVL
jgi:hypothetical protein